MADCKSLGKDKSRFELSVKENYLVSVLWRNSLLRYSLSIADNNSLVLLYFECNSKGFLTLSLSLFVL